jgi:hypothetical protein
MHLYSRDGKGQMHVIRDTCIECGFPLRWRKDGCAPSGERKAAARSAVRRAKIRIQTAHPVVMEPGKRTNTDARTTPPVSHGNFGLHFSKWIDEGRLFPANRLKKAAALLGRKFRTMLIAIAPRSVLTPARAGRGDLLHRVADLKLAGFCASRILAALQPFRDDGLRRRDLSINRAPRLRLGCRLALFAVLSMSPRVQYLRSGSRP